MNKCIHRKFRFTLLELLIVVGVMGILIGISIPSFSSLRKAGESEQSITQVGNSLNKARVYAISNKTETMLKVYSSQEYLILFNNLEGDGREWLDIESGKPEVEAVRRVLPGKVTFKSTGTTMFSITGRARGKSRYDFFEKKDGDALHKFITVSKVSGRVTYEDTVVVSEGIGDK